MRYMTSGNYRSHLLMRLTLGCTLVFLTLFWASNALLYFKNMDLTTASVVQYYNGDLQEFSMPRTYGSMLEVTHAHLPMMAMVLLLLTHLVIFIPWSMRTRVSIVLVAFSGGLLSEGAGWLVRFVNPSFAALKILGFLTLEVSLAFLLIALGFHLARKPTPDFVSANRTGRPRPQ